MPRIVAAVFLLAFASQTMPAPLLCGRVETPDGKPVAGARVELFEQYCGLPRPGAPPRHTWDRVSRVETDAQGAFAFPCGTEDDFRRVLPSSGFLVRAIGEAGSSMIREVVLREEGLDTGPLVLLPSVEVTGAIVDGKGAPVCGAWAELRVILWRDRGLRIESHSLLLVDRSDGSGRVRFPPIPHRDDWSLGVKVEHPDFTVAIADLDTAGILSGKPLRVALAAGLTVTGRLCLADGSPAADVEVTSGERPFDSSHSRLEAQTRTDAEGRFTVRGVPVRRGALKFGGRPGLSRCLEGFAGSDGDTVDVGTVTLEAGRPVAGRVLRPDGSPAARVCVRLSRWGHGDVAGTGTDDEGRFRFEDVPPDNYVAEAEMEVEPGDELRGSATDVRPGAENLAIRLTRAGSVLFVFHAAARPSPGPGADR
jgi:hypothetical protein